MNPHEKLKRNAFDAIDRLHADTSVSPGTTLNDLQELAEHIEAQIEAVKLTAENIADETEFDL